MGAALIVVMIGIGVTSGVYWVAIRPVLRERRLSPVRLAIRAFRNSSPEYARTKAQQELAKEISRLDKVGGLANRIEEQARALPVPVPPPPQRGTAAESMDAMSRLLNDPKIAIAVAGGEQLVANLFDMAQAGAAAAIGNHLVNGLLHGARDAVTTTEGLVDLGKALLKEGSYHFKDVAATMGEHLAEGAAIGGATEVGEHLSESFDLESAGGFHFPFVTLLITSAREGKLLLDGKTSADRALGHVALDTGATAAGGFAGAKAGAALGTVIAPGIGTAVGGLLGTIFGAMGGRKIATDIKHKPLREAAADYGKAAEEARVAIEESTYGVTERVYRSACTAREEYQKGLAAPRVPLDGPQIDGLKRAAKDLYARIAGKFDEAKRSIDASSYEVGTVLPRRRWYDGVLGLDVSQQSEQEVSSARADVAAALASNLGVLPSNDLAVQQPVIFLRQASSIALPVDGCSDQLFDCALNEVRALLAVHARSLGEWSGHAALRYRRSIVMIAETMRGEAERHHKEVTTWRTAVEQKRNVVERHKAALGL